jgi:hypothetical protein
MAYLHSVNTVSEINNNLDISNRLTSLEAGVSTMVDLSRVQRDNVATFGLNSHGNVASGIGRLDGPVSSFLPYEPSSRSCNIHHVYAATNTMCPE